MYFMDELKYSITEQKNIEEFEKAKVVAMVSVREGGYAGTMAFIGKWQEYPMGLLYKIPARHA